MRRRLSYANVVATLALVFAMSGGALAANHYLINSTKQINPKVLKKLKGNTGARGPAGPAGPAGASGAAGGAGAAGAAGKEGAQGPAGTAVAYAHVLATGELDTAHSKNVSASSKAGGTGIFCLKVTVPVTSVSGAVDTAGSSGAFGALSAIAGGQDPTKIIETLCPAGDNVLAGTFNEAGANANMAFWINFN